MINYTSNSENEDSDYSYNEEVKDEDKWYEPKKRKY